MRGPGRTLAGLAAVMLVAGVAGCAPEADLDADAGARLQEAVAEVVAAAEQGRFEAAQAAASEVRAALAEAADDGDLSVARYRQIDEALTRTEAELSAALQRAAEEAAAQQAAAEQAAAEQAAAEQAAAEQAAAEQAAAEQAAAEQAAAERPAEPSGPGDGKPGPGHGRDDRRDHRGPPGKHG